LAQLEILSDFHRNLFIKEQLFAPASPASPASPTSPSTAPPKPMDDGLDEFFTDRSVSTEPSQSDCVTHLDDGQTTLEEEELALEGISHNESIRQAYRPPGEIINVMQFPTEILLHIFSYLKKSDLKATRLVCHLFHDIVCLYNPCDFWENVRVPRVKDFYKLTQHPSAKFIKSITGFDNENASLLNVSIPKFPRLERINLSGCHKVKKSKIISLCKHHPLKSIDLSYCGQVNDSVLKSLATLPHLEELYLDRDILISHEGLEALAKAKKLKTLSLKGISLTKKGILALNNSPSLQRLYINGSSTTQGNIPILIRPLRDKLKYLNLSYTRDIDPEQVKTFLEAGENPITVILIGCEWITPTQALALNHFNATIFIS